MPTLADMYGGGQDPAMAQQAQDQARNSQRFGVKTPDPNRPGFYTDGTAIPGSSIDPANVALQNAPAPSGDTGWDAVHAGLQGANPNYVASPGAAAGSMASVLGGGAQGTGGMMGGGSGSDATGAQMARLGTGTASPGVIGAAGSMARAMGGPINPATGQPYQATSDPAPPATTNPITLAGAYNGAGTPAKALTGDYIPAGSVPSLNEAPGNYTGGMKLSDYMDPSYAWRLKQGQDALTSTYGAQGNMLSGPALKGVTDYSQGAASTEYGAANNRYMADKQFNLGTDQTDRAFDYNAKLNDQTIPFDQQMKLAGLGLSGSAIGGDLSAKLAAILSGNAQAVGQVQGSGTYGQNASITNAINGGLGGLTLQQVLARYMPPGG